MQIYIASLAQYNNSVLDGFWYDFDVHGYDADDLKTAIQEWLAVDPERGEEYAVHDYDGVPGKWGEYPDLDKLCAFLEQYEDLDAELREAFEAWKNNAPEHNTDVDDFRQAYAGQGKSKGDWAQGWYEDSVGVPDKDNPFSELYGYVDWDQYAREQEMGEMWFFEESIDITHAFWR